MGTVESFLSLDLPKAKKQNSIQCDLDMLKDVPMVLTAELDAKKIELQDLFAWSDGSVVNLDKSANDVVEIFLNGKVFGKAKIIDVDGCYGLEIMELNDK